MKMKMKKKKTKKNESHDGFSHLLLTRDTRRSERDQESRER